MATATLLFTCSNLPSQEAQEKELSVKLIPDEDTPIRPKMKLFNEERKAIARDSSDGKFVIAKGEYIAAQSGNIYISVESFMIAKTGKYAMKIGVSSPEEEAGK